MANINGHILLNTRIAVDVWKRRSENYVHFLSHCHSDHTVGLSSTWRLPIYTTHFNAWLLKNKFRVKSDLLQCLSIGNDHIIGVPGTREEFTVTLIDANHCPGSVMFLFQGSFGTILYTGDFRYDPVMLENKILAYVMKNELLDVMYVDNTFASPHCKIPSRKEAAQQALQIIRDHPHHKILLGLRNLGKEELLSQIALEFCEKICVSEDRLAILQKLQYEDVFTTDPESCRIHVVNFHSVTPSYMRKRQLEHPHIAIIPTALYECGIDGGKQPFKISAQHRIYHVPYSDHTPYEELYTFISHLKPTKIYPIIHETKGNLHRVSIKALSTLTDRLCHEKRQNSISCLSKELAMSCDTQHEVLPARIHCNIKHTKSLCRTQSVQRNKLSMTLQKKGVQFESSFNSDEDDSETSLKDITLRMPGGLFMRVKVPHNLKGNWSGAQVKLYDSDFVQKYGRERTSEKRGDANSYTMSDHTSGDGINSCSDIGTVSEEPDTSFKFDFDGNLIKDKSHSCAVDTNHTINAQVTPSMNQILFNTISDLKNTLTEAVADTVKSEEEFKDKGWPALISLREDGAQEHDIMSDDKKGDISQDMTEDMVTNPTVKIPMNSYTKHVLLNSCEFNTVTGESQNDCQCACNKSLHNTRWNKPNKCQSCSRASGITLGTHAGLLDLNCICTTKCSTKEQYVSRNTTSCSHPCLPCNIDTTLTTQNNICESNFHEASDYRIQVMSVRSVQASDWSSDANLEQSDTGRLFQFSPASTHSTSSDAQSHDEGNQAVTGYHRNRKRRKIIACVNETSRVTSEIVSHSLEEPEINSSMSQNEQSLNHCPPISDTCNIIDIDGHKKGGVQCEEMFLSQNTARITASFQQMEVVTAESGDISISQSEECEEGNVTTRNQIVSEHSFESERPSDMSLIGSQSDCENKISETGVLMRGSTNVGESYNLRKKQINNTGSQSMDQNIGIVIADKSVHGKHDKCVRNTPHSSKESNTTATDECETFVEPGMPVSTNQVDHNYWTNGNRIPFAVSEVLLTAQQFFFP